MLIHLLALSNDAVKIIQNFIVSFKSCSAQFEQCFSINSLAGLTEHYAFLLISIKLSQAVPIKFLRVYVCVCDFFGEFIASPFLSAMKFKLNK